MNNKRLAAKIAAHNKKVVKKAIEKAVKYEAMRLDAKNIADNSIKEIAKARVKSFTRRVFEYMLIVLLVGAMIGISLFVGLH